jgi:hypothetical protein
MSPAKGRAFLVAMTLASLAPARGEPGSQKAIVLPPLIVTDRATPGSWRSPWKHINAPGFEILSSCGLQETEDFATDACCQRALLELMIPPGLLARSSVPTALILFPYEQEKQFNRDLASLASEGGRQSDARLTDSTLGAASPVVELIPQVKLWDEDSTSIDILVRYRPSGGYVTLGFEPDYVFQLVSRRAPALPAWYVAGALTTYAQWFESSPQKEKPPANISGFDKNRALQGDAGGRGGAMGSSRVPVYPRSLQLPPATWISEEITLGLCDDPRFWGRMTRQDISRRLIPLGEFFGAPPPRRAGEDEKAAWLRRNGLKPGQPGDEAAAAALIGAVVPQAATADSPWRAEVWRSEAALLVRWSLDDPSGRRARALQEFVDRSSREAPSEAAFRECFGLGYEAAARELDAYIPVALGKGFEIEPDPPIDAPQFDTRPATAGELARILGDWQRKEMDLVRRSHPQFAPRYAAAAEATLLGAYEDGERDPRLLAALGLYECDVGADRLALRYLEDSVRAGVERPAACVQLARLRLSAAMSKPAGARGLLNRSQVESVLDPIRRAGSQSPPQLGGYRLAVAALEHGDFIPASAQVAVAADGLRFFPGDFPLVVGCVQLEARSGDAPGAVAMIDRALDRFTNPKARRLLAALKARYAPPPPAAPSG